MKSFLLDTHVWLWSILGDEKRISESIQRELVDPNNELWLSSISIWETLLLFEKNRIKVNTNSFEAWVRKKLDQSPIQEAPINHEIVFWSRRLQFPHKDPADRFIAATSKVYQATLITADKNLFLSKEITCLKVPHQ